MKFIFIFIVFLFTTNINALHYSKLEKYAKNKNGIIFGSYRYCYDELVDVVNAFEKMGANILAPIKSSVLNEDVIKNLPIEHQEQILKHKQLDFVLLKDNNPDNNKQSNQDTIFIKSSYENLDFVYIMNGAGCTEKKYNRCKKCNNCKNKKPIKKCLNSDKKNKLACEVNNAVCLTCDDNIGSPESLEMGFILRHNFDIKHGIKKGKIIRIICEEEPTREIHKFYCEY